QTIRAAVQIGGSHDLIARFERGQHGRRRGQSGSEGQPALAAFQRGQTRFQGRPRRIAAARVFVALVLAERGLRVGGSRIDRDHRGPGGRVRVLAGVNGPRRKALLVHASSLVFFVFFVFFVVRFIISSAVGPNTRPGRCA